MAKSAKTKHQAKGRARRANNKPEHERRSDTSTKADLTQRPLQQLCSLPNTLNTRESLLDGAQSRTDSGLSFQALIEHSISGRPPTPALTLSTTSLPTEDESVEMNAPTISLALRTRKSGCPVSIVHPVPARPTHDAVSAWQDNPFTIINDKVERESSPDIAPSGRTPFFEGHEPCRHVDAGSSTSWVIVSNDAAMLHAVRTAVKTAGNNSSESSSGTSSRGQTQGISTGTMQRQTNNFPKQLDISDEDVSGHESGEEPEPPKGVWEGNGYRCIFCATDNGTDPTPKCSWPRKYVSQLKVHHLHSDHPGGPFGCCKNCFAIGFIDVDPQSGDTVFIRFKSKKEVSTHERSCIIHICIQEGCPNYTQSPPVSQPCRHQAKRNGSQIWKMWFRRAHDLSPYDYVPEPHGSTAPPAQIPPFMPRPPQRPHLVTPVTPERPSTGPPVLQHGQYGGLRGIAPNTSPSVDPLTPSDSRSRSSSTGTSSQQGLERLARDLLDLASDSTSSWSPTLERLYNSTRAAAEQRMAKLAVVDSDLTERITNMQTLIDHCRDLMTGALARTRDALSHLNIAARMAFPEPLLSSLPGDRLPVPIVNESLPSMSSNSYVSNQMSNIGTRFEETINFNNSYTYPTALDINTSASDLEPGVRDRVQAQAAGDNFDHTRKSYTKNLSQLWSGLQASRRSDVQSVASAPNDSGIYSAEGTTDHSGNDKDPGARRPSMSNIRDPNNRYRE